jgi:hypothetical protein
MKRESESIRVKFSDLSGLQRAQAYVKMANAGIKSCKWVEVYNDNGQVKSIVLS